MVNKIPEPANVSFNNESGEEKEMDTHHEDHENTITANSSPETVTHDPIDIEDSIEILTEFRTDTERDDLIFRMDDEVRQ